MRTADSRPPPPQLTFKAGGGSPVTDILTGWLYKHGASALNTGMQRRFLVLTSDGVLRWFADEEAAQKHKAEREKEAAERRDSAAPRRSLLGGLFGGSDRMMVVRGATVTTEGLKPSADGRWPFEVRPAAAEGERVLRCETTSQLECLQWATAITGGSGRDTAGEGGSGGVKARSPSYHGHL